MRSLSIRCLLTFLLLTPLSASAFSVFHSPADDGVNPTPGQAADLPIGAPHKDFNIWVENGTGAASGAPCNGTEVGLELCGWDLHIDCDPNVTVVSFTAEPAADAVVNQQASFVRVNGGDPFVGTIGAARIGQLRLSATGPGSCNIVGEIFVDNELNGQDATQIAFVDTCDNDDQDLICTAVDPCAAYTNVDLTDTNTDGIPDECQCGDSNGNGLLQASDAFKLAECTVSPGDCTADVDIADTNNNGQLQSSDAFNLAAVVVAPATNPASALTCARRPEGTPVP